MNETAEHQQLINEADDYLHVGALIMDYLRFLRSTWFLLLLGIIIAVSVIFVTRSMSFVPNYSAKVYYSLERTSNTYTDAEVTNRVAAGVSTLTATRDFRDSLLEAAGLEQIAASYSFAGEATADANLFSVTIWCSDFELANTLLQAFESVYPAWVSKSVGKTTLTVTDEVLSTGAAVNTLPIAKRCIYAAVVMFVVWFVVATIRIFTVRKIHSEDDMDQVVKATCLGILPDVVKKKREKSEYESLLISNENIDGNYLQAVRSLASRVEYSLANQKKCVLLVTSTLENEGKSLLTMNLAMVLSRHGKRVVVVDGDMYNSGISRLMGIQEDQFGLSDYLCGKAVFQKVFLRKNGIVMLPAGKMREESANNMNMKRLYSIISILRKAADVVLIDTPPTGQIGDAVLFSEIADRVLYVVRGDYAELRDIRKGIEPFVQSRKLLGYVLNRVNSNGYSYGYKYGYGASYARYRNYGRYGSHYGSSTYGYGPYGHSKHQTGAEFEFEPEIEEEDEG